MRVVVLVCASVCAFFCLENAFVEFVCGVLRAVARLLCRTCCVVFVRVCFATSVLMRVIVCCL